MILMILLLAVDDEENNDDNDDDVVDDDDSDSNADDDINDDSNDNTELFGRRIFFKSSQCVAICFSTRMLTYAPKVIVNSYTEPSITMTDAQKYSYSVMYIIFKYIYRCHQRG